MNSEFSAFDWHKFSEIARERIRKLEWRDSELLQLLAETEQPTKNVDAIGRPLVGTALVNQHPDPENYRRVLGIRREIAIESRESDYVVYSNVILDFLATQSSFSGENSLFIVDVMTSHGEYEFLYTPQSHDVCAQIVTHLSDR